MCGRLRRDVAFIAPVYRFFYKVPVAKLMLEAAIFIADYSSMAEASPIRDKQARVVFFHLHYKKNQPDES